MARIRMRYILWGQHECYDAWLQEVQTKFRSMPSVKKLAEEIKEMRRRKKAAEGGIDLEIYRNYKYLQQQRWLNYYEDKLVKQLESVVQKAGSEEGCLTVVVLPEALIRDYELEERKKERKYNYVNPLYEKTVFNFLGPSMRSAEEVNRVISEEDGNKTILQFTAEHQEVIVFAGTVWWKQWKAGYPNGVLFNSAPVFYRGRCCLVWDKQFLAEVDGLMGENLMEQWIRYRIDAMPMTRPVMRPQNYPDNVEEMDTALRKYYSDAGWQKLGILSSLSACYNPAGTPLLAITWHTGVHLIFGIDICKDAVSILIDRRNETMIIDIDGFVEDRGDKIWEDLGRRPVSEWFAEHSAPIAVVGVDGCCSLIGNRENTVDINVIVANDLRTVDSKAKYYVCKSDMRDSEFRRATWLRGVEEEPLTVSESFFWISDVFEFDAEK